jgi:hypothetical protein
VCLFCWAGDSLAVGHRPLVGTLDGTIVRYLIDPGKSDTQGTTASQATKYASNFLIKVELMFDASHKSGAIVGAAALIFLGGLGGLQAQTQGDPRAQLLSRAQAAYKAKRASVHSGGNFRFVCDNSFPQVGDGLSYECRATNRPGHINNETLALINAIYRMEDVDFEYKDSQEERITIEDFVVPNNAFVHVTCRGAVNCINVKWLDNSGGALKGSDRRVPFVKIPTPDATFGRVAAEILSSFAAIASGQSTK